MDHLPHNRLVKILRPAYKPCPGFRLGCEGVARDCPGTGHAPRGFVGALSSLKEVKVVIVGAEPGDPLQGEIYRHGDDLFDQVARHTFDLALAKGSCFHTNLAHLLDLIFPGDEIRQQLEKAWVTESYLCTAPGNGYVRKQAERECVGRYLQRQLDLFGDVPIIACGAKARERMKLVSGHSGNVIHAISLTPQGVPYRKARASWEDAARRAREMMAERSR